MKKSFVPGVLICALLCAVLGQMLPWWHVMLAGLLTGALWFRRSAFLGGFLAGLLCWGISAIYFDLGNDSRLSSQLAEVLKVGAPWALIALTAAIGGLACGAASLLGYMGRRLLFNQ